MRLDLYPQSALITNRSVNGGEAEGAIPPPRFRKLLTPLPISLTKIYVLRLRLKEQYLSSEVFILSSFKFLKKNGRFQLGQFFVNGIE